MTTKTATPTTANTMGLLVQQFTAQANKTDPDDDKKVEKLIKQVEDKKVEKLINQVEDMDKEEKMEDMTDQLKTNKNDEVASLKSKLGCYQILNKELAAELPKVKEKYREKFYDMVKANKALEFQKRKQALRIMELERKLQDQLPDTDELAD
jgi:hypothetical protein